jgi:hypothetical protein
VYLFFEGKVDLLFRTYRTPEKKGEHPVFENTPDLKSEKTGLQFEIEGRKGQVWMEIPLCSKTDLLHHAHGVDLHEDRFRKPVPFKRLKKLPMRIADLPLLLIDIHPDVSICSCLSPESKILTKIPFTLFQEAETHHHKNGEDHRKENPNDPMKFYSADSHFLTYIIPEIERIDSRNLPI